MTSSLRLFASAVPLGAALFSIFLVGCPDGVGLRDVRQDDGGDADTSGDSGGADADASGDGSDAGSTKASGSALCGVNGRDDCGSFLACDESLGCVECRADADCPAAAAFCLQGQCVGCRPGRIVEDGSVPDCRGTESACWASDYGCHAPCGDAVACPSGTTCDKPTGECLGCTTNAECGPTRVCSSVRRRCVDCVDDTTCPASRPRCRVATGTCAACTSNADCGLTAPVCDPLTFTCREGCISDAQCPGRRCDAASATCVSDPVVVPDAGSAGDGGDSGT